MIDNSSSATAVSQRKIQITAGNITVIGILNDSPTANQIWDALPIQAAAETWGDEIYFGTPVSAAEDAWAQETVPMGAIGYWPPGRALCLFFGPTPMSRGHEIRPASAVNLMGSIEGDPKVLKQVPAGAPVSVKRSSAG